MCDRRNRLWNSINHCCSKPGMDWKRHCLRRLVKMVDFLNKADSYHGIFPHFMNGATGKTIAFGKLDDGADIVETSYLLMGFLCAREYFNGDTPFEKYF